MAENADCIFCKIRDRKINAKILFESQHAMAFQDISPQAPVHLLIIPKKHISSVADLSTDDASIVWELHNAANELARKAGLMERGFRLITNSGPDAGQSVNHLHYHLLGGRKLSWPPG